ncbi:UPF0225 protein XC_4246 [Chlamydiales bacterium SCGC AG-110-P3]|nr:UPF0225 protein XC_4246 [Chlamydiales bacterium SCGC AG-110-P3]
MEFSPCPCGSGKHYYQCCGPLHKGAAPPDALTLMRSRYSAYATGNVDYIIDTTHPDNVNFATDKDTWRKDIEGFTHGTTFEGLEVLSSSSDGDDATVSFRAHMSQNGLNCSFSEKSRFRNVDGKWLYVDGKISPV